MVAPVLAALLFGMTPFSANEAVAEDSILIKRVQSDGVARWEQVSGVAFRAFSADKLRGVIAVSQDAIFSHSVVPNDPFFRDQWNFAQIYSESVWALGTGEGVIVAVADSGLTPGPDLACRTIVAPYDAVSGGFQMADIADGTGHGTHVTGTIAQCTNNAWGVAGLAHGVIIMPIRVLDDSGVGSAAWLANGIAHAVRNGAHIINLSLGIDCVGGTWPECGVAAVDIEIAAALAAGVVLVASVGNESIEMIRYPANHPGVIAVGATNSARERAEYSNWGRELDVMAPGGDYVDRDGDGEPDLIWQETIDEFGVSAILGKVGTSMAAPHVSATVALMKQANPTWTPLRHRCVLRETARDLGIAGFDVSTGAGEIVPYAAVMHSGEAWSDVEGGWYEPAVSFVADAQIAGGYADCTFRPSAAITRAEAVTMLVRAMEVDPFGSPTGMFHDLPAGSVFAPYVEAAAHLGWVQGYPDGRFGPNDYISRAEFSALVVRARGFTSTGTEMSPFHDVLSDQWFYGEVLAAWVGGAVAGYGSGLFKPHASITRAETAQVFFNVRQ